MGNLILNADLGEGEDPTYSRKFIQYIDAANIACGGHAGDQDSIKLCLEACLASDTLPGAHPGTPGHFGRGPGLPSMDEFSQLLESQWLDITQIADTIGTSLHHIKLHGSLYMAIEHSESLTQAYLDFLGQIKPTPVVFALAGGQFIRQARTAGFTVWGEIFADRHYQADGTLRSRENKDALISDPTTIGKRVRHWIEHGKLLSVDGSPVALNGDTLCIHSDIPNAISTAQHLHRLLSRLREQ